MMNHTQPTNNRLTRSVPTSGLLSWTIACSWLLMLATISPPDRGASIVGSLDIFAVIKVSVRLLVIVVLGTNLFRWWQHRRSLESIRWFVPFAAFIVWAILSTAWSANRSITLGQSISLGTLLLLAISYSLYCREMASVSRVLKHISIGLIVLCSVALFCYFFLPHTKALERYEVDGFLHATNSAATAALLLLLLAGCYLIWNWRWAAALLAPGICVSSMVLLIALNRWAPFVTAPLLLIVFFRFASRTLFFGSILAGSAIGALYLAVDPGWLAADKVLASTTKTVTRGQSFKQITALSGREILWDIMWESFEESPWIGHGYFVTSASGTVKIWNVETNVTAHNFLLQVLVTTGIVGIFLFTLAMLWPISGIWFDLVRRRANTSYAAFCGLLGCWYVGWGVMNSSIAGPTQPESVVFFSALGMGIGLVAQFRTEEKAA